MKRRNFLASTPGIAITGLSFPSILERNKESEQELDRHVVLVRAGFSRRPDGSQVRATPQQTVVRSSDSEGRLAAFVVPVGEHAPYGGAPLHVHHEQDEWLFIIAGEFVAEVGGKRMRLKPGDSLLMPMKIPHRWSHASQPQSGVIHLYTPAGNMDVWWDPSPNDDVPKSLEQRKAEFEKYGTTLLGAPLTKDEIDQTA
jgi:mannose-6-phosphate isomerase-like protein (cupin superfamily)